MSSFNWLKCFVFCVILFVLGPNTVYGTLYLSFLILIFFSELIIIFLQVSESLLQATIKCLVDVVNSETATIASVAMEALGHIGLRVPLPPLDESSSGESC